MPREQLKRGDVVYVADLETRVEHGLPAGKKYKVRGVKRTTFCRCAKWCQDCIPMAIVTLYGVFDPIRRYRLRRVPGSSGSSGSKKKQFTLEELKSSQALPDIRTVRKGIKAFV
jgi:hypothetical protein